MSATLTPGACPAPELRQCGASLIPPLPARYITRLADVLQRCGYGPEFCDWQQQGRDVWGPAGALLRSRRRSP